METSVQEWMTPMPVRIEPVARQRLHAIQSARKRASAKFPDSAARMETIDFTPFQPPDA